MTEQSRDAIQALRSIWAAEGGSGEDLGEVRGTTKSCKNMTFVSFDGLAEPGTDLRQAWRDRLEREGKLSKAEGSIRDLVLGPELDR
jgi:hypothetical protein